LFLTIPAGFSLSKGERIEWHGRRSYLSQIGLLLLGVLCLFLGVAMIWFGIGIIFFLIAFFRVYSTEYVLTNQRVHPKMD